MVRNNSLVDFYAIFSAKKAGELADKWRKCLRRIPFRPKSAQENEEKEEEIDTSKNRRRSPRLAVPTINTHVEQAVELTEEEIREREAQKEEHRRTFENQVVTLLTFSSKQTPGEVGG